MTQSERDHEKLGELAREQIVRAEDELDRMLAAMLRKPTAPSEFDLVKWATTVSVGPLKRPQLSILLILAMNRLAIRERFDSEVPRER